MVFVVEDWDDLTKYAGDKQGFYQVLAVEDGVQIRVFTCEIGFKKTFKNAKDPLLDRITKFCALLNYIKVTQNIPADKFFR